MQKKYSTHLYTLQFFNITKSFWEIFHMFLFAQLTLHVQKFRPVLYWKVNKVTNKVIKSNSTTMQTLSLSICNLRPSILYGVYCELIWKCFFLYFFLLYRWWPKNPGTIDFLGLKIIKFAWELFILWVISYGLSFSGFAIINRASELWKSGKSRKLQSIRNYS